MASVHCNGCILHPTQPPTLYGSSCSCCSSAGVQNPLAFVASSGCGSRASHARQKSLLLLLAVLELLCVRYF